MYHRHRQICKTAKPNIDGRPARPNLPQDYKHRRSDRHPGLYITALYIPQKPIFMCKVAS